MKDKSFDQYARRARLQPALLVALPAALTMLACFPTAASAAAVVWSLIVWSGGTALIAQLGRDGGKSKQPWLFARWGGKPTLRMLRHRDTSNAVLLEHRHLKLRALLPHLKIPTADEERKDPILADATYDTCTLFLLEKTRSREAFPLVFEANCDYGFRRNLWGMKGLAMPLALGAAGVVLSDVWIRIRTSQSLPPTTIASGAAIAFLLAAWVVVFTPNWVKTAADAFAERLLGALEIL
jgi:hypothetical protein